MYNSSFKCIKSGAVFPGSGPLMLALRVKCSPVRAKAATFRGIYYQGNERRHHAAKAVGRNEDAF